MADTLHNDLPTLDDKLGWKDELDRLALRIQGCPTPHVLGIHGDWGSGKTSFMRQLQWRLGGEMPEDGSVAIAGKIKPLPEQKQLRKEIATVWFDAWRYQNEPVPLVALLQEMRRQMAALPAVMEKMKKLGAVGFQTIYGQLERLSSAAK
jgi:ABC-type dipeptide/oligopeptide/nickel transport system ATPase subunit